MSGAVALPGAWLGADGAEHECTIRGTCLDDLELGGGPELELGVRVVVRVPDVGTFDARVAHSTPDGVRLAIDVGPDRRRRLDGRIRWAFQNVVAPSEQRRNARVVPNRRDVAVLSDGSEVLGRIADVSADAAAIILTPRPAIGSPVSLRVRRCTVVRHTEDGFAVRFVLPLRLSDVTEDITF